MHAQGAGPKPLLLTHGWPGSFLEYSKLAPLLSDPDAHGADPADAFTVIVPPLPGYGFSDPPPPAGLTGREVARLWHELMTTGLGYDRYVAHGSDLGAGVTAWLARDQPHAVAGIHLATPGLAVAPGPRQRARSTLPRPSRSGPPRRRATCTSTRLSPPRSAPRCVTARPDSPLGSQRRSSPGAADGRMEPPRFDRELLLATLTLYWATNTIASSLLPYWAHNHVLGAGIPAGEPSPVPTAVTIFGGERVPLPEPPRELAERYYNITAWAEHAVGGHFPAVAEPDLLARILRETFRPIRNQA